MYRDNALACYRFDSLALSGIRFDNEAGRSIEKSDIISGELTNLVLPHARKRGNEGDKKPRRFGRTLMASSHAMRFAYTDPENIACD